MMNKNKYGNKEKVGLYFSPGQIDELKKIAQLKDVSYGSLVRQAVREFIERENKKV